MKKFLSGIFAIALAIVALSFTTTKGGSLAQDCTWYIYDNPNISNPSLDFPSSIAEATDLDNYRVATEIELDDCDAVRKVCAVCAFPHPSISGKPNLAVGQAARTELENYFQQANESLRVPNPNIVLEKFEF